MTIHLYIMTTILYIYTVGTMYLYVIIIITSCAWECLNKIMK